MQKSIESPLEISAGWWSPNMYLRQCQVNRKMNQDSASFIIA